MFPSLPLDPAPKVARTTIESWSLCGQQSVDYGKTDLCCHGGLVYNAFRVHRDVPALMTGIIPLSNCTRQVVSLSLLIRHRKYGLLGGDTRAALVACRTSDSTAKGWSVLAFSLTVRFPPSVEENDAFDPCCRKRARCPIAVLIHGVVPAMLLRVSFVTVEYTTAVCSLVCLHIVASFHVKLLWRAFNKLDKWSDSEECSRLCRNDRSENHW